MVSVAVLIVSAKKEARGTYCIFKLMDQTTAVYVILPSAKIELSSVNSASPKSESMLKYTTIASTEAMNIQPR